MTIQATPIQANVSTGEFFVSQLEAKDALRLPVITPHLARCVAAVNQRISQDTGYVPLGSACSHDLDGGGCYLFLPNRPITGITEIRDLVTQRALDASEFEQRCAEQDYIYWLGGGRWPEGQLRWRVSYVAGTNTPPVVLRSIALAMIAREYAVGQENAQPPMTQDEIDDLLGDYYRIG